MTDNNRQIIVTVIIATLNSATELEKTLNLLSLQTYKNLEIIVIDGKSQDNTINILNAYPIISKWISEKDNGIYNAMNKGILLSNGEWLSFINAGDSFHQRDTLEKIMKYNVKNIDIIYGDVVVDYGIFKRRIAAKNITSIKNGMVCCHQSMLIRRSQFKDNLYNEKYKFVSDFDHTLGSYLRNSKFKYIPIVISNYLSDGVSSKYRVQRDIEVLKCIKYNLGYIPFTSYLIAFSRLFLSFSHNIMILCGFDSILQRLKRKLNENYH
jgi:glycosyltransferase involved in cell wall biosynthesis